MKEYRSLSHTRWDCRYFVSTVGLDEALARAYIRSQEQEDERYDPMKLGV